MQAYSDAGSTDDGEARKNRLIILAIILVLLLGIIFIVIAFSSSHWTEDTVDRSKITTKTATDDTKYYYYSRHNGVWTICLNSVEKKVLDTYKADQIVDGNCLYVDYEIPEKTGSKQYGTDYWARVHLMRAQFAFFVVALLFLVIACISGAVGCWRLSATIVKVTGLIAFIAAFFTAAGMAFFHGAEYLERNKIKTNTGEFFSEWPKVLSENTTRSYGWSYILGWIGMVFAAIAAILFLVAGYSIQNKYRKGQDKVPYDDYTMRSRNKAYDYMANDRGYPGGGDPRYPGDTPEYFAQPYPAPAYPRPAYDGPAYQPQGYGYY